VFVGDNTLILWYNGSVTGGGGSPWRLFLSEVCCGCFFFSCSFLTLLPSRCCVGLVWRLPWPCPLPWWRLGPGWLVCPGLLRSWRAGPRGGCRPLRCWRWPCRPGPARLCAPWLRLPGLWLACPLCCGCAVVVFPAPSWSSGGARPAARLFAGPALVVCLSLGGWRLVRPRAGWPVGGWVALLACGCLPLRVGLPGPARPSLPGGVLWLLSLLLPSPPALLRSSRSRAARCPRCAFGLAGLARPWCWSPASAPSPRRLGSPVALRALLAARWWCARCAPACGLCPARWPGRRRGCLLALASPGRSPVGCAGWWLRSVLLACLAPWRRSPEVRLWLAPPLASLAVPPALPLPRRVGWRLCAWPRGRSGLRRAPVARAAWCWRRLARRRPGCGAAGVAGLAPRRLGLAGRPRFRLARPRPRRPPCLCCKKLVLDRRVIVG